MMRSNVQVDRISWVNLGTTENLAGFRHGLQNAPTPLKTPEYAVEGAACVILVCMEQQAT